MPFRRINSNMYAYVIGSSNMSSPKLSYFKTFKKQQNIIAKFRDKTGLKIFWCIKITKLMKLISVS